MKELTNFQKQMIKLIATSVPYKEIEVEYVYRVYESYDKTMDVLNYASSYGIGIHKSIKGIDMDIMEQGRSLQQKHNNFKDDCVALLILAVLIILYNLLK